MRAQLAGVRELLGSGRCFLLLALGAQWFVGAQVLGGGGLAEHALQGSGLAEHGAQVLGGSGLAGGGLAGHAAQSLGGGGLAEHAARSLGGGGLAEHAAQSLGGRGLAEHALEGAVASDVGHGGIVTATREYLKRNTSRGRNVRLISDEGHQVLSGFELGLAPSQPAEERSQCLEALREVGGPLVTFLENVTADCGGALARCIPAMMQGLSVFGDSTPKAEARVKTVCPKKMWLLFSASYDPFLPANAATMAVLHAAELTSSMHTAIQGLADEDYFTFGFQMGRAVDQVMPMMRLPLTEADLSQLVAGFINAFVPASETTKEQDEPATPANVTMAVQLALNGTTGDATADSANLTQEQRLEVAIATATMSASTRSATRASVALSRKEACISGVRGELDPANRAIMLVASSMLNFTCFQNIGRFKGLDCVQRAVEGLRSFFTVLKTMYNLRSRLEEATCPRRFVRAMRSFDNEAKLALDVLSNSVEDVGEISGHLFSAADAFYTADMYQLGGELGVVYQVLTDTSFHKYEQLEVNWVLMPPLWRFLTVLLVPPLLFGVSALPVLCLFCSACSGRPPMYQEIVVQAEKEETELQISYGFFGSGPYGVNSEIEFDVEPIRACNTGNTYQGCGVEDEDCHNPGGTDFDEEDQEDEEERTESDTGSSSSSMKPHAHWGAVNAECTTPDLLDLEGPRARSIMGSNTSFGARLSRDPGRLTTERLAFRLTDELPRMGWIGHILCNAVWILIPCLAKGTRRWELTKDRRRPGRGWPSHRTHEWWLLKREDTHEEDEPAEGLDTGVEGRVYVNAEETKAPVADSARPMAIQVHGVASAILRLKPATQYKECWDLLLFLCASAQLFGSLVHLAYLAVQGCFFRGQLCTLFWRWCCFATAVLALHKKVHARWWASRNREQRLIGDTDLACCGLFRIPRTPTPVALLAEAPAVLHHQEREAARPPAPPSKDSLATRLLGLRWQRHMLHNATKALTRRLRPWAYRYYSRLAEGDRVRVLPGSPWRSRGGFWTSRGPVYGRLLCERPDEDTLYAVRFDSGEEERLARQDFQPVLPTASGSPDGDTARPGYWHDRLTEVIINVTLGLWATCAILLLILPPGSLADDDGYLMLRLVSPKGMENALWVTGLVIAIQVACILLEGCIRFTNWAVSRLLLLFVYAGL